MNAHKHSIPLLRLVLPFLLGVILGISIPVILQLPFWVWLLLIIISVIGLLLPTKTDYRLRWAFGTSLSVLLVALGCITIVFHTEYLRGSNVYSVPDGPYTFEAKVIEPPEEKHSSIVAEAEVGKIWVGDTSYAVTGKVLLNLEVGKQLYDVEYGDCLLIEGSLEAPEPPKNPGEFNYKQYLAFQQIYKRAFIPDGNWKLTGENSGNGLLASIYQLRGKMLQMLESSGLEGENYAVASALILGYKNELEEETVKTYTKAGSMHILAVSGLHVGIIYLIAMFLFKFLDRVKRGNIIKALLVIAVLVLYAMMTGLSPSVNRAVIMFSFLAVASCFKRQTSIFNTLAASVLFLVLIDPYIITKVGFQMSYLAVIGIVCLYPKLYYLWVAPNFLVNWLWQVTCVSLAAQLATFPLTIYYFHQFPNYFLLFNPISILGAFLVVALGLGFFLFSWIPMVQDIIGEVLNYILSALNYSLKLVDLLPYAITPDIDTTLIETLILYSLVIAIIVWLASKRYKVLMVALNLLLVLVLIQLFESAMRHKQKVFAVYSIENETAFEFIHGRESIFFATQSMMATPNELEYKVDPNWLVKGIENTGITTLEKMPVINHEWLSNTEGVFQFEGKRIAVIRSERLSIADTGDEPIEVDYLLISGNPYLYINNINKHFAFETVIFDASNSDESIDRWIKECQRLGVKYVNVKDGYFELKL